MLNNKIPRTEIYNALKEFVDPADLIINDYNIEKQGPQSFNPIPVKNNSELLGKLHHALNIDQYSKAEFREKLLIHAEKTELRKFFEKINLVPQNKNLTPKEILNFCKVASKFQWGNNEYTKTFVKIFDYDESLIPIKEDIKENVEIVYTAKKDPDTGIVTLILNDDKPLRELYFYQAKIFFEADELVENNYIRFILTMPTGSGKTRTAMEIVTHFFNRGDERQVIWLAGQKELNEQAIESFKHVWPHLGKQDIKIYRIWEKYESYSIDKNSFVFAGITKLSNLLEKYPDLVKPDLIVVDEAHHAIAPKWKSLIENLCLNTGARVIGLTATPIRGDNTLENNELRNFFQDRILEIDSKDEVWPIEYLQKKGYLAKVIEKPRIKSDEKFTIPLNILKAISRSQDYPEDFLEILAKNNKRNYSIIKKLIELGLANKRTLYFGVNRFQTKLMCTILIAFNIKAAYVDGDSPIAYRNDTIQKFKEGKLDIICNCELFTTGFDEPKIEAIVIGRPTKSKILHQQMIGRGMRGPKMNGTSSFELYEMDDSLEDFGIEGSEHFFAEQWS